MRVAWGRTMGAAALLWCATAGAVLAQAVPPLLVPIIRISGEYDDALGRSVLALGDINGDGKPDFGASALGVSEFRIYFGGQDVLDPQADVILRGGRNAVAGDFNGDGLLDVVTSRMNRPPASRDSVYFYPGKAGPGLRLATEPASIMAGEQVAEGFGRFMAAGDMNHDGYDDLVVTACDRVDYSTKAMGAVMIFMGRQTFSLTPDFSGMTNVRYDLYGFGVNIGDVNGDGYPDLCIGLDHQYNPPDPPVSWRQLRIHYGHPNWTFDALAPDQVLDGRNFAVGDPWRLEFIYSSVFDINNDGISDVYVRYYQRDSVRCFVLYGRGDYIRTNPDRIIANPDTTQYRWLWPYGHRIRDINGDGYDDYVLRVDYYVPILLFYPGSKDGMCDYYFARHLRQGDSGYYGEHLTSPGDMNGDGLEDVLTGGPTELNQGGYGEAIVLKGDRALVVAARAEPEVPSGFAIGSGYPNPFSDRATIELRAEARGRATVAVFDLLGRLVATLFEGEVEPGTRLLRWNGRTRTGVPAPSGLYTIVLECAERVSRGSLLVVR